MTSRPGRRRPAEAGRYRCDPAAAGTWLLLPFVHDFRVDDVAARLRRAGRRAGFRRSRTRRASAGPAGRTACLGLAIQRLGGLVLRGGERVERALNRGSVLTLDRLLQPLDRRLDSLLLRRAQLLGRVFQHPLGGVDGLIGAVAQLDLVPALLVL